MRYLLGALSRNFGDARRFSALPLVTLHPVLDRLLVGFQPGSHDAAQRTVRLKRVPWTEGQPFIHKELTSVRVGILGLDCNPGYCLPRALILRPYFVGGLNWKSLSFSSRSGFSGASASCTLTSQTAVSRRKNFLMSSSSAL